MRAVYHRHCYRLFEKILPARIEQKRVRVCVQNALLNLTVHCFPERKQKCERSYTPIEITRGNNYFLK